MPKSLRGDLTKWYQEIQTGVYVGNVNARVRELVWERVMKNIGTGEATMVYNAKNEVGYQFRTTRKDREVIDLDGIPLMMHLKQASDVRKHGFSDMAKFHRAKVMSQATVVHKAIHSPFVAIDLETTGLDVTCDEIISIGAVKSDENGEMEFARLVKIEGKVSGQIENLTGISNELLGSDGVSLETALHDLKKFIGSATIVGYNVHFDTMFLSAGFKKLGQTDVTNNVRDLMPVIKKNNRFLKNYRLETVLKEFDIKNTLPHRALNDARATYLLANKLIKNSIISI